MEISFIFYNPSKKRIRQIFILPIEKKPKFAAGKTLEP
jgi:hypothetical protein